MRYRVVKWADYQHYKDRCPKWIKLHASILTSKAWVKGSNDDRVLMLVSMLLASREEAGDGTFDGDPEYVQAVAYLHKRPSFSSLVTNEFLEVVDDASNPYRMLADDTECERSVSNAITEESRVEEKRRDIMSLKPSDPHNAEGSTGETTPYETVTIEERREALRTIARRLWQTWKEIRAKALPNCRPPSTAPEKDLDLIVAALRIKLPCPEGKDNEWYCTRAIRGAYGDRNALKWTQITNIFRNYRNLVMYYTKAEEQGGLYHQ